MIPISASLSQSCLVFVLAGGRGSRLHELTDRDCKPAVSFAGSCRIIDFALANVINSGMKTALVATQYQPARLTSHIRSRWRSRFAVHGGAIECLDSGCETEEGGYAGTADAVMRNIAAIDARAPQHVLIAAADHIYQMDYSDMLSAHVRSGAAVTIAADVVPRAQASSFGVIAADPQGRIVGFAEKPAHPAGLAEDPDRSLASMGVYVFDWLLLRAALIEDARDGASSHDFGKDILPALIARGNAFAHRLTAPRLPGGRGYWRDVGTLDALHEAHMDLLCETRRPVLDLEGWPLHVGWMGGRSRDRDLDTVSLIYPGSEANSSFISQSVVGPLASVGRGACISNAILMPGSGVRGPVRLTNVILAPGVIVSDPLVAGEDPEEDALWFRCTPKGVVLVDQAMIERRADSRRLVRGWAPTKGGARDSLALAGFAAEYPFGGNGQAGRS